MKWLVTLLLCWTVQAHSTRVIDGDSFLIRAQIWPGFYTAETVRVLGVNTPELKGRTKLAALEAKAFTEAWLNQGEFTLETCGRDAFGRLLSRISRSDSVLAEELLARDLGVVYKRR